MSEPTKEWRERILSYNRQPLNAPLVKKKDKRKKYDFNSLEFRHLKTFSEYFFKDYQLCGTSVTRKAVKASLLKVPFTVSETQNKFILEILGETKKFNYLLYLVEYVHKKVMQNGIHDSFYDAFPHLESVVPRNILNKDVNYNEQRSSDLEE